jgi:hypothetical protein
VSNTLSFADIGVNPEHVQQLVRYCGIEPNSTIMGLTHRMSLQLGLCPKETVDDLVGRLEDARLIDLTPCDGIYITPELEAICRLLQAEIESSPIAEDDSVHKLHAD